MTSIENNETSGLSLRHTLQGHTQEVNRIAWSPDGRFLASSSFDGTVCLWDAQTGHLSHTFKEHSGPVYSVAWIHNSIFDFDALSSCGEDQDIAIYYFSPTPVQGHHFRPTHGSAIYDLAWSDRKSTRLNSSHANISYAVFCLKKKNKQ